MVFFEGREAGFPIALIYRKRYPSVQTESRGLLMAFDCRGCSLHSRSRSCLCLVFCVCGSAGRPGQRRCRRPRGSGYPRDSFSSSFQGIPRQARDDIWGARGDMGVRDDAGGDPSTALGMTFEGLGMILGDWVDMEKGQKREPIRRTRRATTQAIRHWPRTTPAAHLPPSSRRMAAMAATQGV